MVLLLPAVIHAKITKGLNDSYLEHAIEQPDVFVKGSIIDSSEITVSNNNTERQPLAQIPLNDSPLGRQIRGRRYEPDP